MSIDTHGQARRLDPQMEPDGIVLDVKCSDCRANVRRMFPHPWPDGLAIRCLRCADSMRCGALRLVP